ncbi:MAG TPA: isocitrate lyase/phosphoenolpyruvate mutase family protein [Candidatus Acidoferrum sp.]|jgi:2-methylisocitrate lyase-like PEP mutase family enzyme
MNAQSLSQKADHLRELHHGPRILVLPNAWDASSARIVEESGFPAIATTSAGVAFTLGHSDGQIVTRDEMLAVVARIARAVSVPVTADMEAGYGNTPAHTADTAKALLAAGAVGLNLEDLAPNSTTTLNPVDLQTEKIRALRDSSKSLGASLVINARTDIYLGQIGDAATRFDRTVERLRAYRQAGADCLFVPGINDRDTIEKLVRALQAPLNVLIFQGCPTIPDLEKIGVARASTGSATMRATLGLTRRIAKELFSTGTYSSLLEDSVPFAEANKLFTASHS